MSKFSNEVFTSPVLCTGSAEDLRVFWSKEERESNPGQEPPVRVDDQGNPLMSVSFMRKVEEYGREKPILFSVTMPKNQVDPNLKVGYYELQDAAVQVYADRKNVGQIRESW